MRNEGETLRIEPLLTTPAPSCRPEYIWFRYPSRSGRSGEAWGRGRGNRWKIIENRGEGNGAIYRWSSSSWKSGTSQALLVPRRAKDSTFIVGKFRNGSCPLNAWTQKHGNNERARERNSERASELAVIDRGLSKARAILARREGKKGGGNIIPPSQIEKAVQDVHGSSIVRGRDRFSNSRITRMNEQNQDNTEDSVQQGGEYKVHQSSDGDHPVHPRVQTRRAWKLSVKNLIPFRSSFFFFLIPNFYLFPFSSV